MYKPETNYVLSFYCSETFDKGVLEFETYTETFEQYKLYQISGYAVRIHELGLHR